MNRTQSNNAPARLKWSERSLTNRRIIVVLALVALLVCAVILQRGQARRDAVDCDVQNVERTIDGLPEVDCS